MKTLQVINTQKIISFLSSFFNRIFCVSSITILYLRKAGEGEML